MIKFLKNNIFYIYLFICFSAQAVEDPVANNLGNYNDWGAYSWNLEEGKVCSILSYPKKEEGKYSVRGEVLSQVTMKEDYPESGIVSFKAGYPIKPGSKIEIIVDGKTIAQFDLFRDQMAWASDVKFDAILIKAMKKGTTMVVNGVSSKGTKTKDTYSLRGFTASHKAISKTCK